MPISSTPVFIDPLAQRLLHGIVPAVPIPFRVDGTIHLPAQESYLTYMQGQPIAGVAVWAHTGRGLHLNAEQRAFVLEQWRRALPDKIIVAGVGGDVQATTNESFLYSAMKMGEQAATFGADAFLVYPPTRALAMPHAEAEQFIVEYHRQLASFNLPLILFHLYRDAGGVQYAPATLARLAAIEKVVAIKIATADSVITYQELVATLRERAPRTMIITGEDRFFGYSLMMGADAALVGMGSAMTGLQKAMMDAYYFGTRAVPRPVHAETARWATHSFLDLSARVDALGRATFGVPLQGYIRRMLWVLVELGVIPEEAANDPWGPELSSSDRLALRHVQH